ncbi:aminoglycoside adenylyltransferase domain-containing protein [Nocardioides sp. 503]|uniref:aminoglycoside adenylyltransferase domain-containing protein n=1 Tax=Nocardioides sp. 503 TaxID=2508326 RepID=UPI001070498B|nr:aminoglycoside adenylyltransferase domain-containing protein [Nocardioides sp. 503]
MDTGLQQLLEPQIGSASAADLAAVLDELAAGARGVLGPDFLGVHLLGSFALGRGDEHSDVDFLVVTADRLDDPGALRDLHARLPDLSSPWASHLEGSYAPVGDLASPMTVGRRWWYVDNGSRELVLSDHDNTAHTRWVLRENGRLVAGAAVRASVAEISVGMLRAEAVGTARTVAELWEDEPATYATAWGQPFVVLTLCRVLYTATEGAVTDKTSAARWARERVPERFAGLVDDAIASRPDPWGRVHRPADSAAVALTRDFVWEVVGLVGRAGAGAG